MAEKEGPEKGRKPLKSKGKNPAIDTTPTLNEPDKGRVVNEDAGTGIPISQVDYLVRMGLGDREHLVYYRRAIMDPHGSIRNPQYREYVGNIAWQLLTMIWGDPQMFNRLRTLLQMEHKGVTETSARSLARKADESGVDLDVIMEVFDRGMEESGQPEIAFNRVNSFLAGGKAIEEDCDLAKEHEKKLSYDRVRSFLRKKP